MSLKLKIFFPLLLASLIGGAFLSVVWLPENLRLMTADYQRLLDSQLASIGDGITPLLLDGDLGAIYPTLDAVKAKQPQWLSLQLLDADGRRLYPLQAAAVPHSEHVQPVTSELRHQDVLLGELKVLADFSDRHRQIEKQRLELLVALFGGVLVLGVVAVGVVEVTIRRPLTRLATVAERMGAGDFHTSLPPHGRDEVAQLIQRFGAMRQSIRHQRDELNDQFLALRHAQDESVAKSRQIISILENTSDAYFALDRDLRFTFVNSNAERLLHTPSADFLQRRLWDLCPELGSHLEKPVQHLLAAGDPVTAEAFYAPLGLWLECHLAPMDDGIAMYVRDITKRKRIARALRASEENNRAILDNVADGIITTDQDGRILSFNASAERIFGYDAHEVIGSDLGTLLDTEVADPHREWARNLAPLDTTTVTPNTGREISARRKDGTLFHLEATVTRMRIGDQAQYVGIVRDVTERRKADEQLRLAEKIFKSNSEGIVVTDDQTRILRVNTAFQRITGYPSHEVIGRKPSLLSSGRHDARFYSRMWKAVVQEGHWQGEIWNRRKCGDIYPEWLSLSVVYNDDGSVSNYVGIFSDITQKKAAEDRIHYMAHHDTLTGLINRPRFNMELRDAIEHAADCQVELAVLYVDLDHFKKVNDTLGHPVGDELLKIIATRLKDMLRDTDVVCRIGGDEFIVLLRDIKKTDYVGKVAHNLINALSHPIELAQRELFVGASIGIALYPADAESADELIKNADTALFQAKQRGRHTYQFYSQDMNAAAIERLELDSKLRRALKREEYVLYYQPQLDVRTGQVVGAEALVRWQNDELGLVPPAEFIPLLEDSGLIVPVGEWILRTACRQAKAWQDAGLGNIRIAVNIAPHQFLYSDVVSTATEVLTETGLAPELLELEITEGSIMSDGESSIRRLQKLSSMGVQLAIDDFGTGYSSLAYLKRFPIDALKIDQSFVRNMHRDLDDANIATAVVSLGRSLGLRVIAEGVEEAVHLDRLRELGCDEAQGYFISRTMPAADFDAYLRARAGQPQSSSAPV